ncbi:MAG: A24 family peptidase [Planctomycetota bacterium]
MWFQLAEQLHYCLIALYGLAAAVLANHVIYTFCYFPRAISPWVPRDPKLEEKGIAPRSWKDRVPILGWLQLRRESSVFGRGHWIRPMMIEVFLPIGLMALYVFEVKQGGLMPEAFQVPAALLAARDSFALVFLGHALLIPLMVAATFIDFDEQTIPDIITVPGTWLALIVATMTTQIYMPSVMPIFGPPTHLLPTTFEAPWFFKGPGLAGFLGSVTSLRIGLAIWAGWNFAMLDRRFPAIVVRRRGIKRAIQFFVDGVFAHGGWKIVLGMWLIGSAAIIAVYSYGGSAWHGLLTALIGLAGGGGLVWAIRLVAGWSMGVEAMGFGDVTFMAMIGAFVGWQASITSFFLAPFAAIGIVIIQFAITRNRYTPFGPYLAAGTLISVLIWPTIYGENLAQYLKTIGPVFIWIGLGILALMAVLLMGMRGLRSLRGSV